MSRVEGKNIYLSGPMTGVSGMNRDGFAAAEITCLEGGAEDVYNPADIDNDPDGATREQMMLDDIQHLVWWTGAYEPCDVVVQFPGWDRSRGSVVEHMVAAACGITVMTLEEALS